MRLNEVAVGVNIRVTQGAGRSRAQRDLGFFRPVASSQPPGNNSGRGGKGEYKINGTATKEGCFLGSGSTTFLVK
jgi:hypothetical protein